MTSSQHELLRLVLNACHYVSRRPKATNGLNFAAQRKQLVQTPRNARSPETHPCPEPPSQRSYKGLTYAYGAIPAHQCLLTGL